jgi:hypothetical protein
MKSFHRLGTIVSLAVAMFVVTAIVGFAGQTSKYSDAGSSQYSPSSPDTPYHPGTTQRTPSDTTTRPGQTVPERAESSGFSWGSLITGLIIGGIGGYLFGRSGESDTSTRYPRDRAA